MPKETDGFVDLHTHILHSADDGAANLEQALDMLQYARNNGTSAVLLTPHFRGPFRGNVREKLEPLYHELVAAAREKCPGLELYLGCEVGYELDIYEKLLPGTVLTLNNTRYVLLEFRDSASRSRIMDGTLEMLNFGYVPIIAHVERYETLRKRPQLVQELSDLGALLQLNADSIMGGRGLRVKWFCYKLLKAHLVHFVSSDAHDLKSRVPALKSCYEKVKRRYGKAYARLLFRDNARAVLSGGEDIKC